jgi:hypothetical protein
LIEEITLSLQNEKIEISQNHQTFFQLISAQSECAQSSIKKIFFSSQNFFISIKFAGFQNVFCTKIALVFGVYFAFISFKSIFRDESISQ